MSLLGELCYCTGRSQRYVHTYLMWMKGLLKDVVLSPTLYLWSFGRGGAGRVWYRITYIGDGKSLRVAVCG